MKFTITSFSILLLFSSNAFAQPDDSGIGIIMLFIFAFVILSPAGLFYALLYLINGGKAPFLVATVLGIIISVLGLLYMFASRSSFGLSHNWLLPFPLVIFTILSYRKVINNPTTPLVYYAFNTLLILSIECIFAAFNLYETVRISYSAYFIYALCCLLYVTAIDNNSKRNDSKKTYTHINLICLSSFATIEVLSLLKIAGWVDIADMLPGQISFLATRLFMMLVIANATTFITLRVNRHSNF
jgi:hypothetical protein